MKLKYICLSTFSLFIFCFACHSCFPQNIDEKLYSQNGAIVRQRQNESMPEIKIKKKQNNNNQTRT